MSKIRIRPGLVPYTLSAAVLLTRGSAFLKDDVKIGALLCWAALGPVVVAAIFDRIEFDGEAISHRGALAFVLSTLFRVRRRLAVKDIETITTEATSVSFASGDA